jgi:hypothetical protein
MPANLEKAIILPLTGLGSPFINHRLEETDFQGRRLALDKIELCRAVLARELLVQPSIC